MRTVEVCELVAHTSIRMPIHLPIRMPIHMSTQSEQGVLMVVVAAGGARKVKSELAIEQHTAKRVGDGQVGRRHLRIKQKNDKKAGTQLKI